MIAALAASEVELLVLIIGIAVMVGGAYVAYIGRIAAGAVIALIGLLLILFAG